MTIGTDGPGVSNVDYILYVSARDSECPTSNNGVATLAFAGACQMEDALDRPVAGYINFCPAGFTDTSNEFLFSVTKHEIIHALAFARSLFPFWRDTQGQPRTQRSSFDNLPPIVSGSVSSHQYLPFPSCLLTSLSCLLSPSHLPPVSLLFPVSLLHQFISVGCYHHPYSDIPELADPYRSCLPHRRPDGHSPSCGETCIYSFYSVVYCSSDVCFVCE